VFFDIIDRPEIGTSSIDWAKLSRILPEDGDRIQSPKRCVSNTKQDDGQRPKSQQLPLLLVGYQEVKCLDRAVYIFGANRIH
jgi:hypothetical protein